MTDLGLTIDALAAIQNRPEQFVKECFGQNAHSSIPILEIEHAPMMHKLRLYEYNPIRFYKSLDLANQRLMEDWINQYKIHILTTTKKGGRE